MSCLYSKCSKAIYSFYDEKTLIYRQSSLPGSSATRSVREPNQFGELYELIQLTDSDSKEQLGRQYYQ